MKNSSLSNSSDKRYKSTWLATLAILTRYYSLQINRGRRGRIKFIPTRDLQEQALQMHGVHCSRTYQSCIPPWNRVESKLERACRKHRVDTWPYISGAACVNFCDNNKPIPSPLWCSWLKPRTSLSLYTVYCVHSPIFWVCSEPFNPQVKNHHLNKLTCTGPT